MKIQANGVMSLSFGRALKTREQKDFSDTVDLAKKELNIDDGISMFKVFSQSLPQKYSENTGIGKLNSDESINYLKFMKLYTGSNAVKIFPIGSMPTILREENFYCPYERSSISLETDNINFFKLQEDSYGNLLSSDDLKEFARLSDKKDDIDWENELDKKDGINQKLLEIAYDNMKKNPNNIINLEFNEYKNNLKSDSFDRLAIVPFIRENDIDLFKDFENSPEKQNRFKRYRKKYSREIDLLKFANFLSQKNLKEAKEKLAKEGLELYGDCPIGFREDEVIAFPDAFWPEEISFGYGFRSPKLDELEKEGSPAQRLFREKVAFHLENFDGVRFDVGYIYISPRLFVNGKLQDIGLKDSIVEFIEKTAKEIKGKDYDLKKLTYECDANNEEFELIKWNKKPPKANEIMKERTAVLTSFYEHSKGFGYGNAPFYENVGLKSFIIGTVNHDGTPTRILAEDEFDTRMGRTIDLKEIRKDNISALKKSLKLSEKYLSNAKNFVKAKFAELFLAKNHFVFFNDVMGSKRIMNTQVVDTNNWRIKISNDYESEYHKALQEGDGFNLAESLRLAMRAKGINRSNPELYRKIAYYSELLAQKGPTTRKEADALDFPC